MPDALVIDALTFRYRREQPAVIEGLSYSCRAGTRLGVWGPNGSGKTTLLNLVAGLLHPERGTITLDGRPTEAQRRRIAMIAADFDLFEYLSVEENVRFVLDFYEVKWTPDEFRGYVDGYALNDFLHQSAVATSRGIRRKTQIVAALLMHPRMLVADEPLDGLDEAAQRRWFTDTAEFAHAGGIAMFSLHDRGLMHEFTDGVLSLDAAPAPAGRDG